MRGWILLACLGLTADFSLAWRLPADSGAGGDLRFHDRAHMIADIVNRKHVRWKVRSRLHSLERYCLLSFLFYCSLLFSYVSNNNIYITEMCMWKFSFYVIVKLTLIARIIFEFVFRTRMLMFADE